MVTWELKLERTLEVLWESRWVQELVLVVTWVRLPRVMLPVMPLEIDWMRLAPKLVLGGRQEHTHTE